MKKENIYDRRRLLKHSAAGVVGAGTLLAPCWLNAKGQEKDKSFEIKEYHTLGRTGFKVSVLYYENYRLAGHHA